MRTTELIRVGIWFLIGSGLLPKELEVALQGVSESPELMQQVITTSMALLTFFWWTVERFQDSRK